MLLQIQTIHQQVKVYLVLQELKVEAAEDKVKVQKLHQQEVEDKHMHQLLQK